MSLSLLTTKLTLPTLLGRRVERPGLIEHLHAGFAGLLTLLSAPASYGKTTLLVGALHQYPVRLPECRLIQTTWIPFASHAMCWLRSRRMLHRSARRVIALQASTESFMLTRSMRQPWGRITPNSSAMYVKPFWVVNKVITLFFLYTT